MEKSDGVFIYNRMVVQIIQEQIISYDVDVVEKFLQPSLSSQIISGNPAYQTMSDFKNVLRKVYNLSKRRFFYFQSGDNGGIDIISPEYQEAVEELSTLNNFRARDFSAAFI